MDKKRRAIKLLELYINETRKKDVEEWYGAGSKIKIHNLNFSSTQNSMIIEGVIMLGEVINEEVMDRSIADILIQDSAAIIFPEVTVKAMVRWDVL